MKQFIRNFRKQKTVGILNISGLSLGIMCSVIIGLWGMNELSFDNFHNNGENIYRTNLSLVLNNTPTKIGSSFKPLGEEAINTIPEIKDMCRVAIDGNIEIKIENKLYEPNRICMADSNFFTYFNFPLLEGNPQTVLSTPDGVVISKSFAERYFPQKDPIGQSISFDDVYFTVSGIMKNMPINSHLQADAVLPFFGYYKDCTWGWSDVFNTYLTVGTNTDLDKVEKALTEIYDTNMTSHLPDSRIELQPLKDIHFGSGFMNDQVIKGNKPLVFIFILTAAIILIISCINFINLFVSTSFIRAKTIGIKKAQGADKRILIYDFYKETAYYVILSIIIGLLLAFFSVPVFNQVMDVQIFIDFRSVRLYVFLFILFILTVLIAGSFPALYMTRFGIIETLREKFKGKKMSTFQKSLVILQFSASVTLLIIIFFFNKQVDYMVSADMGFEKENVFYIGGRDNFGNNFESFRAEMLQEPTIKDVTMSRSPITEWRQGWSIKTIGKEETVLTEICRVKPNFFDFFNIKFVEGYNPLNTFEADSLWVGVINQTAARLMEFKDPIDKELITHNKRNTVIKGVIHDAQTRSFHTTVDPQVYFKLTQDKYNQIYFKVSGNPAKAIAFVENKWKEQVTDAPFEYHFLDDTYKQLYITETNAQKLLTYAMFISFFITMVGLFAISYYSLQRRVKEIGIRKVNGATLSDLLILLNKDFLIWVLISFIIACPISYFFVKNWLDNFTIKTSVDLWIFLLAGIFSLLVALFTVSYQTWKSANMNPVESLKNE